MGLVVWRSWKNARLLTEPKHFDYLVLELGPCIYVCTNRLFLLPLQVSRWNELRSSSTVPFFGRSTGWSGGEAFRRRKEQYSTMRECCSTCLSNYGSRTRRHYVMAPPPTPKSYKYSSPFGLRVAGGCVVGGRDSVGLVYIGLATQELFVDLRLSPGSSLAPGIRRDPSMIFTIN